MPFLRNILLRKIVAMYGESCHPEHNSPIFHSTDPKLGAAPKKITGSPKCLKKYLVWQAMDMNGNFSKSVISRGTVELKMYLERSSAGRRIWFLSFRSFTS